MKHWLVALLLVSRWYIQDGYSPYGFDIQVRNGLLMGEFAQAAASWREVAPIRVVKRAPNLCEFLPTSRYSWYGYYRPLQMQNGQVTRFLVQINGRALQQDFPNSKAARLSTMAHEFGHGLYLRDLGRAYRETSLMSRDRDRTRIVGPQQLDFENVRALQRIVPYVHAHADWPVYGWGQLVRKSDLIVEVRVERVQEYKSAQLATLQVRSVLQGEVRGTEITLDQAVEFLRPGQRLVLFLARRGHYYYEVDGNSKLFAVAEGKYESFVPGFAGVRELQALQQATQAQR